MKETNKLTRREFVRRTAVLGAGVALLPRLGLPFTQTPLGVNKFLTTLPGLGPAGANNMGNYIPVLSPTSVDGADFYSIVARAYTQQVHPAIPATGFLGFADAATLDSRYLGGVIVAKSGTPVKLKVTNLLPAKYPLPVDPTLVDPIMAAEVGGRTDRIAVHLHGGFVPWSSDGNAFQWFSNAKNPGGFVHGSSFINIAGPGAGMFDFPNNQSARFLWYHDHAYGLTRTNAYAGLATAYLIYDDAELAMIQNGIIPNFDGYLLGIPLIIQDKLFWNGPKGTDPKYNQVVAGNIGPGALWYPHVYEGALAASLPSMLLSDPNLCTSGTARWEIFGGTPPPISSVAEFFADTILVNGAPYPTFGPLPPRRYRFRLLNGSQARFYNLQLYVADGSPDGITLKNTGQVDPNGNPILAPANPPGPAFIQIANEAGFLPAPAVFAVNKYTNLNSNITIGFNNSAVAGDPTNGNANRYNLLIAPAERADIIIDLRGFEGQDLILYNDAPAPFPGGDIRNDYYGADQDLTCIGGAPSTVPGFGPDTRVLMRFKVGTSDAISELSFANTVKALEKALPITFKETQPSTALKSTSPAKVKTLNETFDKYGRLIQFLGAPNPSTYLDTPVDFAAKGEIQVWQIYNLTGDTHPMHFHLVNVNILKREQWAFDSSGNPLLPLRPIPGTARSPDANEQGWKETVRMNPGEVITVAMQFVMPFSVPPSPRLQSMYGVTGAEYTWHCHILEHEEHDMMHALVVTG